jgi:hypothetical protein
MGFLFNTDLVHALEKLISNSDKKLLLISPFIDLDKRVQDILSEKKQKHDFELRVLFGKNENRIYKSVKSDSMEFLMSFPNVEIRYCDRLHAKYYQNDYEYMISSMNLYDYSLAKNIEVGYKEKYRFKGIIGDAINNTGEVLGTGIDKVNKAFGTEDDYVDPVEKFEAIFDNSELLYHSTAIIKSSSSLLGKIGLKKEVDGCDEHVNKLGEHFRNLKPSEPSTIKETTVTIEKTTVAIKEYKHLSLTKLSQKFDVPKDQIMDQLETEGLIEGKTITSKGEQKGLVMKNFRGNDYIAFPENLEEFNIFLN